MIPYGGQLDYEAIFRQIIPQNMQYSESYDRMTPQQQANLNQMIINQLTKMQHERFNFLSKDRPNFFDYMSSVGKLNAIPANCTHISIAYHIYRQQEGVKQDPTETGRNIKRARIIVSSEAKIPGAQF